MRYIKTDKLTPGMVPIRSIYDHSGRLLLAANHPLDMTIISALVRIDFPGLMIYDEYSDLEDYKSYCSESSRINAIGAMRDLSIDRVVYCVNAIVDELLKNDSILIDMADIRLYDHDTYEHSVDVCLLATACGVVAGLSDRQLRSLALGAMLHDLGKMSIPKSILNKPGKLTDEEWEIMKTHPQRGYDMLYTNELVPPQARACVLCHHENHDGSGYPNGLSGEDIPLPARIVHIADVYDAMCQKRAYKEKYDPVEVVEFIYAKTGTMFDPQVVNSFLRSVVIYPVGSDVTLSDGRQAHVIKNRASYVTRPVVCIKDTKEILDLAMDPSTYSITIVGTERLEAMSVVEIDD